MPKPPMGSPKISLIMGSRLSRGFRALETLGPQWALARLRWGLRALVEPFPKSPVSPSDPTLFAPSPANSSAPLARWTRIADFGSSDIKALWEPARFALAFECARAFEAGDTTAPERFWSAFDAFLRENPPLLGVHYKCGQEIGLRLIAWSFAFDHFADHPSSTPTRVAALRDAFAVGAERIRRHHYYARSQRNNHSLSEAAGLWTASFAFPELPGAGRWRQLGRRYLEREVRALVLPDGTFSQYSVNYQRVALDVLLWSIALGERKDSRLSPELYSRTRSLAQWLFQLQDPIRGRVPRLGQYDGALVLPLTDCPHDDFRPALHSSFALLEGHSPFPPGPWDEGYRWLAGADRPEIPRSAMSRKDFAARQGGVFVLRGERSHAVVRGIERFRFRPSQSDLHHVDVWWRGINVAQDPGTFSYNGPPPFDGNPLAEAQYHNTLTLDGAGPMKRISRFVWAPWPRGKTFGPVRSLRGNLALWEGQHDGFRRSHGAMHQRAVVQVADEHWVVIDRVRARRLTQSRLHWLLCDVPHVWRPQDHALDLELPHGNYAVRVQASTELETIDLVRADPQSPRGHMSPNYYETAPALSLAAVASGREIWWWTLLGPAGPTLEANARELTLEAGSWSARIQLNGTDSNRLVARAALEGCRRDSLDPA